MQNHLQNHPRAKFTRFWQLDGLCCPVSKLKVENEIFAIVREWKLDFFDRDLDWACLTPASKLKTAMLFMNGMHAFSANQHMHIPKPSVMIISNTSFKIDWNSKWSNEKG